jgi:hypothetical protein
MPFGKGLQMIRARTSQFLMGTVILLVVCGSVFGFSGAGSGTELDPYIITTLAQLQEMRDDVNACYALGNDIDAGDTQTWNAGGRV